MLAPDVAETARAFAVALDAEDYESARALLDVECRYEFRGSTTIGADKIIAMYKESGDWARSAFDEVRYESAVEPSADGEFRIRFRDLTRHRGAEHTHECEQIIRMDTQSLIDRIRHIDLPGQREALQRFMKQHDIPPRKNATISDNAPEVH